MIFVTVGTQLPFDRLVGAVDRWAGAAEGRSVFAQVGPTRQEPQHLEYRAHLSPNECRQRLATARVVVAHAGMGTVLSALELGKPVLVMPRRASLGEHRNDHQLATARRLQESGRVTVAHDEVELVARLDELDRLSSGECISRFASPDLIRALRAFIAQAGERRGAAR